MMFICAEVTTDCINDPFMHCGHHIPHEKSPYGCGENAFCNSRNKHIPCIELREDIPFDVHPYLEGSDG